MSANVERLPAQHKLHPHCPICERDMPTFDDCILTIGDTHAKLTAVTFHVRCVCGANWDLRKNVSA